MRGHSRYRAQQEQRQRAEPGLAGAILVVGVSCMAGGVFGGGGGLLMG